MIKKIIALTLIINLMFVIVISLVPQPVEAAVDYSGTYYIQSAKSSNMVIDIAGGSKAKGANVQLYKLNNSKAQQFTITKHGNYYKITNINSGMVLDAQGGKTTIRTNVHQWKWNNTAAQKWAISNAGNGYVYLTNVASKLSFDLAMGKVANKTNIWLYKHNKTAAQKWKLVPVKKSIPLKSISLNKTSATINVGKTVQLGVSYNPTNTTANKTVTWTTSNSKIASVNSKGLVTGKSAGVTNIIAKVGNYSVKCAVTVKGSSGSTSTPIAVSEISLNKTSASIVEGNTLTLTATISPSNATNKTVTWSSSNTGVATVSGGVVTAKKPGNTVITATANNGTNATCTITVKAKTIPLTGISLNKSSATLNVGSTVQLSVTYSPSNTTDSKGVTWSSSNSNVASVSGGKVTAKKVGSATITAKVGSFSKTCKITVNDVSSSDLYERDICVYTVSDVTVNSTSVTHTMAIDVCELVNNMCDFTTVLSPEQFSQYVSRIEVLNGTPAGMAGVLRENGYTNTTLSCTQTTAQDWFSGKTVPAVTVTIGNNIIWYAVKFYDKQNNLLTAYMTVNPYWTNSAIDGNNERAMQILQNTVQKLKRQFGWTPSTSNYQKAIDYKNHIRNTSYYGVFGPEEHANNIWPFINTELDGYNSYIMKYHPTLDYSKRPIHMSHEYLATGIAMQEVSDFWDYYTYEWIDLCPSLYMVMRLTGYTWENTCYSAKWFEYLVGNEFTYNVPNLNPKTSYELQEQALLQYGKSQNRDIFTIGNSAGLSNALHTSLLYYNNTTKTVEVFDIEGKGY